MIKQIHLDVCDSTQDVLKEQLHTDGSPTSLLVSCEEQTAGRGRGLNKWTALSGTLCFSMNISPHPVMSYSAIEIAVIVAEFFEKKGEKLWLKWPNDLWDSEQKKCGGILVQGSQNNLIAGIGINLYSEDPTYGSVYHHDLPLNKKTLSMEIAKYIHENRIHEISQLRSRWLLRCGHLNQMVRVTEAQDVIEGIFQGLGDYGEALICTDAKVQKIYNGSLRLL